MNQVVSLLVLSTKISPEKKKNTSMNLSFTSERNRVTSVHHMHAKDYWRIRVSSHGLGMPRNHVLP